MRYNPDTGETRPRKRPVDWKFIRSVLRARQEHRRMTAAGFTQNETDWEIIRGSKQNERIVEAVIAQDGKTVWTRTAIVREALA